MIAFLFYTGTFELRGSDPANINIKWVPDKLDIYSNVDILNYTLQLIDNDLTIKSCSNDFYVKWIKSTDELKVNAKSTFSGLLNSLRLERLKKLGNFPLVGG